jgi:putative endonuclease
MPNTQIKGQKWEEQAASYLRWRGYKILEKNFRALKGEVDLIAKKKKAIVFVEVKGRSSLSHGRPEEAVSEFKKVKLAQVASYYLSKTKEAYEEAYFDVVAIGPEKNMWGRLKVKHIQNAFDLSA